MPVTRDQAHRLAEDTRDARRETRGAHQWDVPGIVAAIGKVQHLAFAEVMKACARAAADRTLQTPAAIGDTRSSAWRERIADAAPTEKWDGPVCDICTRPQPDCERRAPISGHGFRQRTDQERKLPPDQIADLMSEIRDRARTD